MIIKSYYNYTRVKDSLTVYELKEHKGDSISDLETAVCKRGVNRGKKTITLRSMESFLLSSLYKYCLTVNNARMITGFNKTDFNNFFYGNTRDKKYTILINTDLQTFVKLYFVERTKSDKETFLEWVSKICNN